MRAVTELSLIKIWSQAYSNGEDVTLCRANKKKVGKGYWMDTRTKQVKKAFQCPGSAEVCYFEVTEGTDKKRVQKKATKAEKKGKMGATEAAPAEAAPVEATPEPAAPEAVPDPS